MINKKNPKTKKSRFKLKPPQKDRLKNELKKSSDLKDSLLNGTTKRVNFHEGNPENESPDPQNQKKAASIQNSKASFSLFSGPHNKKKSDKSIEPEKYHDPASVSSKDQTQNTDIESSIHSHTEPLSEKMEAKEESYEEKIQALEKNFMYLKADFENYKKRTLKEKTELLRYGGEGFIIALANEVLDDFDRAYEDFKNTKSLENFKSGIDLIHKNLQKILNKFHIESKDPQGKPFDPHYHEALSRQPTDKVPKDHVLVTFKKAYTLCKKLIRPAQVVVAVEEEKDVSDSS